DPLDQRHGRGVGGTLAELEDTAVTALTVGAGGSDVLEQGLGAALGELAAAEQGDRAATAVKVALLTERDELLREGTQRFRFREGGADLAVLDQTAGEVAEQRFAVRLVAAEFYSFAFMSHRIGMG